MLACRARAAFLLLFFLGAVVSCRYGSPEENAPAPMMVRFDPSLVDGEAALDEVRSFINIAPRVSGTEGAHRASLYLETRLRELGLETEVDEFEVDTPGGRKTFRNVIGTLNGTGNGIIVLGSHYDTKAGIPGEFKGANDSGSSTGLLLELARVMTNGPAPTADIVFAFFDGEECAAAYGPVDGLHGSKRMAENLVSAGTSSNVIAVIVLDMIGDRDLEIGIPRNSSSFVASAAFDAARAAGHRSKLYLSGAVIDDHVPFIAAGMRAVDLIDFQYGSEPGVNDYWHTEEDTIDKLSAESLEITGQITIHLVNAVMEEAGRDDRAE